MSKAVNKVEYNIHSEWKFNSNFALEKGKLLDKYLILIDLDKE